MKVLEDNSFEVESKSTPGRHYNVAFNRKMGKFSCTCKRFSVYPFVDSQVCRHIQEVTRYCIIKMRQKQRLEQKLERELVLP
jgi:hypothetical protein